VVIVFNGRNLPIAGTSPCVLQREGFHFPFSQRHGGPPCAYTRPWKSGPGSKLPSFVGMWAFAIHDRTGSNSLLSREIASESSLSPCVRRCRPRFAPFRVGAFALLFSSIPGPREFRIDSFALDPGRSHADARVSFRAESRRKSFFFGPSPRVGFPGTPVRNWT